MYVSYSNLFEVIESSEVLIHIHVESINQFFKIELLDLDESSPMFLFDYEIKDHLLFKHAMDELYIVYIYAKNNSIFILKEMKENADSNLEDIFKFTIHNYHEDLFVKKQGLTRLEIRDKNNQVFHQIDNFLTMSIEEYNLPVHLETFKDYRRFKIVSMVSYDSYNLIITYDQFLKEVNISKLIFNVHFCNHNLSVSLFTRNMLSVENKLSGTVKNIRFDKLSIKKPLKIFNNSNFEDFKEGNILSLIVINRRRFFIYLQRNGIFLVKSNPYRVTRHKAHLIPFSSKKHFYFIGRFAHTAYNSEHKYDYLYVKDSNYNIAKFKRPFKKIKLLKQLGYFKIPISSLSVENRIHNNLFVGNEERVIHNLKFKYFDKKVKTYCIRRQKDNLNVIRTNLNGNITSTIIPYAQEYSLISRFKIWTSQLLTKWVINKKNHVNLYFEKKSSKADESSFRVFEKVMEKKPSTSKNYFVLSEHSRDFKGMKEKYGFNIIKKYSFRHFLAIYMADYFISSELPNHLLNDRLYIDSVRKKLMSVPFIFLQHGIMFAKPVDNPMAYGFHKDKNPYNIYKSVISSPLEAGEFYKMNYEEKDLILTGLATLDYAKLEQGADKIAFMPTYRFWEESLIYNNNIEDTSYYKTIMKVIKAFKIAGLLERLLIVPHNKFSQHIYDNMPEYKENISDNPSAALKKSIVFITDYSSAIYDAIYRGAYPIFYWEEKEYLINQYKAIPPVNDMNAPGPVTYSIHELMDTVIKAIEKNYILEEEHVEKYRKINMFNDNKNTDRIVEFLVKEKII
ncbi:CDP-glycerol glycerophosphotransferase family protein [Fictibacillus sp. S7]|uniref:CDP-glycerol glycerophosphotransferase family protein n=1 Tax=Fictibacillus sp. S7 TaxID=2212476 RepID=UPI001010CAEA|nr:CDP-glycerol glycerophosphotransferase family protein [Fictibacillus sp. S7]RXZ01809.1 teichoic acid biosynthesis protein [Fictibacillus sp. S7]